MSKPTKESYDAVLGSLKSKRSELQTKYEEETFELDIAIGLMIKEMKDAEPADSSDVKIKPRAFRSLTVGQAVVKYLKNYGEKKTRSQAIDALLAGGIKCNAVKKRHSIRIESFTKK